MTRRPRGDRGAVVLGWVTKLLVTVTVLGLAGFDTLSVGGARISADDTAKAAARAAAQTYRDSRNLQLAYNTALADVVEDGHQIDASSFTLGADGAITLTLRTEVPTLVVKHVRQLDDWRSFSTTATARAVS